MIRRAHRIQTVLFVFFIINCSSSSFTQIDTLMFDIEDVALDMTQCEKYLFGAFRSLSSPSFDKWTSSDSSFINNYDTLYVMIRKHNVLVIEGLKLPQREAFGEVKFYNSRSELIKKENWVEDYSLQWGDTTAGYGDAPDWIDQMIYRNEILVKSTHKSIIHDTDKGFARRIETIRYRNGEKTRSKIRCNYF